MNTLNKIIHLLPLLLLSCGNVPDYGEPVFGTVKEDRPVVETASGAVSGENRDGVAIFRGIPYGGACEGEEGRFLPPTDPVSWDGVRDCTANGPIAVQLGNSISGNQGRLGEHFNGGHPELFGVAYEVQGENCLVLNVLSPGIDNAKRPVLVYIHGGGFATGSGTLVLGADKFCREQDIVVVGVNHRLNVFGYLYLGHLDPGYLTSGNVGLLDLVKALEWVRDNIALFGGDPGNVTIMGESGGGMKVTSLLAMEKASGLFHKAIIESGSGAAGTTSKEQAAAQTDRLLAALGIDRSDWKDLLAVPAGRLRDLSSLAGSGPVGDDIVLSYNPDGNLELPSFSRNVPIMVGSSADEMGVFTPVDRIAGITEETLPAEVQNALNCSPEKAGRIVDVFEKENIKGDAPWHTMLKIQSLSGLLGGGAFRQAYAVSGQGGAPVYHYLIEYDSPSATEEGYDCSWHTADLPLQFRIVRHPSQEELSKLYAQCWGAFIRTGNPSNSMLQWPAFTQDTKQVVVFDNGGTTVKTDPLKNIREAFE